jgi:transposase
MQQTRLHKKIYYHLSTLDSKEYSQRALERKKYLDDYEKLRLDGASAQTIFSVLRISRASYYRWKKQYTLYGFNGLEPESTRPKNVRKPQWDKTLEEKVLILRRKYVLFGKDKIRILLKREYKVTTSTSTVGRILSLLLKKGLIRSASFYTGKYIPKPRTFNNHAQRLPKGAKSKIPGDLVQIDHMSVKIDSGREIKHFEAVCPVTRYSVGQAHWQATSNTAAAFLDFVLSQLPFPLISVQVDGGCEFRGDFEKACKDRNIPLYVLPPRLPKMNAFVERGNGTVKSEFYKLYDKSNNLNIINHHLKSYKHFYNSYRPHRSLQEFTPEQYYHFLEAKMSQMS